MPTCRNGGARGAERDSCVEGAAVGGALEDGGELFEREGLGEVVAGADAHGLDGGVDGGEGGHDDDDGVRVVLERDLFEEGEAAAAGELEVEQDEVDGAAGEYGLAGGRRRSRR